MSTNPARWAELCSVVLIILGIVGMIQPFTLYLVSYSFVVLLAGMVGFIITSHL